VTGCLLRPPAFQWLFPRIWYSMSLKIIVLTLQKIISVLNDGTHMANLITDQKIISCFYFRLTINHQTSRLMTYLMVVVYGVERHIQQYFSNIVAVSLLVEETGVPRENHRPIVSHWQTLSHNIVSPEWDSNSQR